MTMRYASICAGIEAASVAWEPLGWRPVLLSEIEGFPRAVLEHRQRAVDTRRPGAARLGVPLWGDFTALRPRHLRRLGIEFPDLLVGGTPCQAFSVAGLRGSLGDDRGNLTLAYVRLIHAADPRWAVWENVPGVLSTDDNAFGCFLAGLVGADAALPPPGGGRWPDAGMVAGPRRTAAWRVLDAQYFRLAQRRRRVFVVSGRARDGINPGAVLFEPEGVRRREPPRRAPGAAVAGTLEARAAHGGHDPGAHGAAAGHLQVAFGGNNTVGPIEVAAALSAHGGPHGRMDFESETFVAGVANTLRADGFDASEDGSGRTTLVPVAYRIAGDDAAYEEGDSAAPLTTGTDQNANVVAMGIALRGRDGGAAIECGDDLAHALRSSQGGGDKPFALIASGAADPVAAAIRALEADPKADLDAIVAALAAAGVSLHVRRLLPVECERLQGFPDGYTDIPWCGRGHSPDGPRYKALGNSMAVPAMRWLGQRIEAVEAALAGRARP
jgi:DNA (cytosine-5)-methyltransferase 1